MPCFHLLMHAKVHAAVMECEIWEGLWKRLIWHDTIAAQKLDEIGYMAICLAAALPCVLLPLLLGRNIEKGKPLAQQYWVKANIWIAIFSFIGNYFWTHYFYDLLGAEYTFPSWQLNKVSAEEHPSCSFCVEAITDFGMVVH